MTEYTQWKGKGNKDTKYSQIENGVVIFRFQEILTIKCSGVPISSHPIAQLLYGSSYANLHTAWKGV